MYAIAEVAGRGVGTISRDQSREWWTGKGWSPASDEAKTFDSRDEAQSHASEHCTREAVVVDLDE